MTAEKTQEPIGWARLDDDGTELGPTLAHMMEVHDITVASVFVPFSQSRNKGEDRPSLNWRCTLEHAGRMVLPDIEYGAGSGHCQTVGSNGNPIGAWNLTGRAAEAIAAECEDGKARQETRAGDFRIRTRRAEHDASRETWRNWPDPADVLHSLLLDGSAIDAGGFEDWAGDLGYDTDSRKAETMYRTCVDTWLALRSAFGEKLLEELQEASQDM